MEITKELFESLFSDSIPHKTYLEVIDSINCKVDEIWKYIINASGRTLRWWCYSDCNGDECDEFEPQQNMETIEITGDFSESKLKNYKYNYGFPIELLWNNYKPIIDEHIATAKKLTEERKKKSLEHKESQKTNKRQLRQQIVAKLTPEELKIISFKK